MERLADDVLIILVENHPKANRGVDTGAAFFHFRNFNREKRSCAGSWLVMGNKPSTSSPFGREIRTPTATGRTFRPFVGDYLRYNRRRSSATEN